MIEALLKAAARGVRVVVLVPGKIDHEITYRASRSNYGRMLLGGIQIFEYMAALMHAKTMVVDGVWASVGSTNFDNRSFALNEEFESYGLRRRTSAAAGSSVRSGSRTCKEDKLPRMEFAWDRRTPFRDVLFSCSRLLMISAKI